MTDQKIIIFGNSGSGKSTLARRLKEQSGLAHLDLDTLAWQATQPPARKPLAESKQGIEAFMAQHPNWVIEGCYADLLDLVVPHACAAIFMNLTVAQCQQNARNRPWEPHKYASKAAQDAKLDMLLAWIANYTSRTDEFSFQAHHSLYNQFPLTKHMITSNEDPSPV